MFSLLPLFPFRRHSTFVDQPADRLIDRFKGGIARPITQETFGFRNAAVRAVGDMVVGLLGLELGVSAFPFLEIGDVEL
jgi:hypothetical protein